tara:strand:- start:280 stop:501 length:222 start_codon:yes stop_codon:yes gene_type:complete
LAIAIKNLDIEEFLLPATDQKEIGRAINKKKNATNPRRNTGSSEETLKLGLIIEDKSKCFEKTDIHLLACLNK